MRLFGLFFFAFFVQVWPLFAQVQDDDPYSIKLVESNLHLDSPTAPADIPSVAKNFQRMGDGISIALLKILDEKQMKDPRTTKRILELIHQSFSFPSIISIEVNKKPSVTLFLLAYLRGTVSDPNLRRSIEDTARFVRGAAGQTSTTQTFTTMTAALDEIAARYQIPVGLEYAPNDTDRTALEIDLAIASPASVFDSFVTQKKMYAWSLSDGVYDIYPKRRVDSILDVRIRTLSVTNATGQEVSEAIGSLPEVREWMAKHRVRRRELETGSRWKDTDPRITLALKDVSLRTVLNRVLKERQAQEWIVVRYGDKQEYLAIYI